MEYVQQKSPTATVITQVCPSTFHFTELAWRPSVQAGLLEVFWDYLGKTNTRFTT